MLELQRILTRDERRVLMIVVQLIVDSWLMEFPWVAHSSAPHGSSVLLGHSSLVVAQVVHTVLLSLLLQLLETLLGIGTPGCLLLGGHSALVSHVPPVLHLELLLRDGSV